MNIIVSIGAKMFPLHRECIVLLKYSLKRMILRKKMFGAKTFFKNALSGPYKKAFK